MLRIGDMSINLFAAALLVIVVIVVLALLYGFAYALVTTAKEKAKALVEKAKDNPGMVETAEAKVEAETPKKEDVQEDVFAALEAEMSQEARFNAELHGRLSDKELLSGTGFTEQEEIDAVQEELQKIIENGGDVR